MRQTLLKRVLAALLTCLNHIEKIPSTQLKCVQRLKRALNASGMRLKSVWNTSETRLKRVWNAIYRYFQTRWKRAKTRLKRFFSILVFHAYVSVCYSYVTRMLFVRIRIFPFMYPYVLVGIRMCSYVCKCYYYLSVCCSCASVSVYVTLKILVWDLKTKPESYSRKH